MVKLAAPLDGLSCLLQCLSGVNAACTLTSLVVDLVDAVDMTMGGMSAGRVLAESVEPARVTEMVESLIPPVDQLATVVGHHRQTSGGALKFAVR